MPGFLAGFLPAEAVLVNGSNAVVGQRLRMRREKNKSSALFCDENGVEVLSADTASAPHGCTKQPQTLIGAEVGLVNKGRIECSAKVVAVEGGKADVLLAIVLPHRTWEHSACWADSDEAAALFSHLVPATLVLAGAHAAAGAAGTRRSYAQQLICDLKSGVEAVGCGAEGFSLADCFQALPMKSKQSQLALLRPADAAKPCWLAELDEDLTREVIRHLDLASLVALSATCHRMHDLCADVAPGLKLDLFPHQRAAVLWMQQRERAQGLMRHPTIRSFQCLELQGPDHDPFAATDGDCVDTLAESSSGSKGAAAFQPAILPIWVDTATGELWTERPAQFEFVESLGGMFCDEPGLGKTITMLALILHSARRLPTPPPGVTVTYVQPRCGFYSQPPEPFTPQLEGRRSLRQKQRRSGVRTASPDDPPPDAEQLAKANKRQRRSASHQQHEQPQLLDVRQQHGQQQPGANNIAQHGTVCAGLSEGGSAAEAWVECVACRKWRRLPPGSQAPLGDWVCTMHPEVRQQRYACQVAEDVWDASTSCLLFAPGWMTAGSPGGARHNVTYFRRLLQQHPDQMRRTSPLAWVSRQDVHQLMAAPFSLPSKIIWSGQAVVKAEFGWPVTNGELFQELGFEPVVRQQSTSRSSSFDINKVATWQRASSHEALDLDLEALKQALAQGPLLEPHRVYLSPATLVVVPDAAIIAHWQHQKRQHVRPEANLRVRVYTAVKEASRSGQALTFKELAWETDVILTTFQTLTNEWRRGASSQLLQLHFLRIILDEGHSIGGSTTTNKHLMATQLLAERRWVMTGTPTPNTPDCSVEYLRPLLAFLHQHPYQAEKFWKKAVQEPFQSRQEVGRLRLLTLLQRCMIRASKAELLGLGIPPLTCKTTLLDFAPAHAISYNGFIDLVRLNLCTADWYDQNNKESLLNPIRREYAVNTLRNIHKSCNVAGNCQLQVTTEDIVETMQLVTRRHINMTQLAAEAGTSDQVSLVQRCHDKESAEVAPAPLPELLAEAELLGGAGMKWSRRAREIQDSLENGGVCDKCASSVRAMSVTHVVVQMAMWAALAVRADAADAEEDENDPGRQVDNPQPQWSVPQELIEWLPAYTQKGAQGRAEGFWQADWQQTRSTKCVHLLRRLQQVGAVVPPGGSGKPTSKAILYTQFWEHAKVVEQYLRSHRVLLAVLRAGDTTQDKHLALNCFRDGGLSVLLMDRSGQVGLDLSFVSNVFLLEPIMDGAVEEQVISRAHRMGAKGPVCVETLAMRGTLEEGIVRLRQQREQPGTAVGTATMGEAVVARKAAVAAGAEGRNVLFRDLRPVPVKDLAEYADMDLPEAAPMEDDQQQHVIAVPPLQQQQQQQAAQQRQVAHQQGAGFASLQSPGGGHSSHSSGDDDGEEEEEEEEGDEQNPGTQRPYSFSPAPVKNRARTWPEVALGVARQATQEGGSPGVMAAAVAGAKAANAAPVRVRPVRQRTVRFAVDPGPSQEGRGALGGMSGAAAGMMPSGQTSSSAVTAAVAAASDEAAGIEENSGESATTVVTPAVTGCIQQDRPSKRQRVVTARAAAAAAVAADLCIVPELAAGTLGEVQADVTDGSASDASMPFHQQQSHQPQAQSSPASSALAPAAAAPPGAAPTAALAVPLTVGAEVPAPAAAATSSSEWTCLLGCLQQAEAQAAGLTEGLVGSFLAVHASMTDGERQRHHATMISLLSHCMHKGAVQYMQTCLKRHGCDL